MGRPKKEPREKILQELIGEGESLGRAALEILFSAARIGAKEIDDESVAWLMKLRKIMPKTEPTNVVLRSNLLYYFDTIYREFLEKTANRNDAWLRVQVEKLSEDAGLSLSPEKIAKLTPRKSWIRRGINPEIKTTGRGKLNRDGKAKFHDGYAKEAAWHALAIIFGGSTDTQKREMMGMRMRPEKERGPPPLSLEELQTMLSSLFDFQDFRRLVHSGPPGPNESEEYIAELERQIADMRSIEKRLHHAEQRLTGERKLLEMARKGVKLKFQVEKNPSAE